MKQKEIELLKQDWYNDPCWDIEDTEGFDLHYIELKAYRLGCEVDWEQENSNLIKNKASQLNCSQELASYILNLEHTIQELYGFMVDMGY